MQDLTHDNAPIFNYTVTEKLQKAVAEKMVYRLSLEDSVTKLVSTSWLNVSQADFDRYSVGDRISIQLMMWLDQDA